MLDLTMTKLQQLSIQLIRNWAEVLWTVSGRDEVLWTVSGRDEVLWTVSGRGEVLWIVSGRDEVLWTVSAVFTVAVFESSPQPSNNVSRMNLGDAQC